MMDQAFRTIVEQLGERTPAPGGGAAAGMSASMGTALALMVVRFCQGKPENAAREADLERVEAMLADHVERMLPLAERDAAAFGRVASAYRLPKASDADKEIRRRAVQEALKGAMVVPEEALCMVRDVIVAAGEIRDAVGRGIISDLAAAAELLVASAEGSHLNIRINASYLDDKGLAGSALDRSGAVLREVRVCRDQIRSQVDSLVR